MSKDYEINEGDIDSVIRFLKIHNPENATPEKAIALLDIDVATRPNQV